MTPAISVAGLTRRYHDQVALDDMSVEIEAGSITGLLGRNGAGKTTLLRVLAGHEFPSSGSVRVLGETPGMWFGIVYRRWSLVGTLTFIAAQVTVLLAAALVVTWSHGWAGVGHFFTGLTAAGLTGLLAVLAVALLAGGRATIRRATV
jgi:ABC-type cobalamin/Fe3+-siderophores transport system ATPase subunit